MGGAVGNLMRLPAARNIDRQAGCLDCGRQPRFLPMQRTKRNFGNDSGHTASIASGLAVLQGSLSESTSPESFCGELAKVFQVQVTEVALLRLDGGCLRFLFPPPLRTAGSIPVSSSST